MPIKSPFATTFKTAIKSGTPCFTVITNIAKRTGRTPTVIIKSLQKAGLVFVQKFNGQFICWPTFPVRTSATTAKLCQLNQWQWFINWCLLSGVAKPRQLKLCIGSQPTFIKGCKRFITRQIGGLGTVTKTKTRKARKVRRHARPKVYKATTYKFHRYGRTLSRRYRKAA